MRVLPVVLVAAVIGVGVGVALAYVEVAPGGPVSGQASSPSKARGPQPSLTDPRVEVEERVYDFGTMQRGTTRRHDFVIRNVGHAPLSLSAGSTTCKCTLSEVTDKSIPPGESTHVRLEWVARTGTGPFRQTATVLTNDPLESRLDLVVSGTVTEPLGVVPSDLLFSKVTAGKPKAAQIIIMAMFRDDLQVSDPELSDPQTREFFDVQIEAVPHEDLPDPEAKQGVRVTVTAKRGLPMGRIDQWLTVRTNLPDAETLEIPVLGQVVGDISVHGNLWNEKQGVLYLGHVKSDEGASADLNIVVRKEVADKMKLEVLSCDPPELAATLGEPRQITASVVHVPLRIEIPPGTHPMVRLHTAESDEGRVVLKTSLPEAPELVLSVRFAVER
jgi:Protein of unknown function (DUF1573)